MFYIAFTSCSFDFISLWLFLSLSISLFPSLFVVAPLCSPSPVEHSNQVHMAKYIPGHLTTIQVVQFLSTHPEPPTEWEYVCK